MSKVQQVVAALEDIEARGWKIKLETTPTLVGTAYIVSIIDLPKTVTLLRRLRLGECAGQGAHVAHLDQSVAILAAHRAMLATVQVTAQPVVDDAERAADPWRAAVNDIFREGK